MKDGQQNGLGASSTMNPLRKEQKWLREYKALSWLTKTKIRSFGSSSNIQETCSPWNIIRFSIWDCL